LKDKVIGICHLVEKHHAWRRSCLNMIASESVTSPLVEALIASDFSRRYSSKGAYAGDKYFVEIYQIVMELAKSVFKAKYVDIRPIVGNMTVLACVTGLTRPGDTIMTFDPDYGGYPIAIADWAGINVSYYPFDPETLSIKVDEAREKILVVRPNLVIFGASQYLFPHPVAALAETAHEVGATVYYDGSHVMGLIAGGQFQDPFAEGTDVLAGSTHKTLPGPQRGIVATDEGELSKKIDAVMGSSCFLQSNFHPATLVALGVALAEVKQFGAAFAVRVVKNAQALAKALAEEGIPLLGAKQGYTRSHQVILKTEGFGCRRAVEIKNKLEEVGIISDVVPRFGVQEVTRLGMKEAEMKRIVVLIADAILERRPPEEIREDVRELAAAHQKIHFSFQDGEEAYLFIGSSMLQELFENS